MEDRLEKIEVEIAHLRKMIETQNDIIRNLKCENHSHIHYEYKNLFVQDVESDPTGSGTGDNFPPNIY